MSKNNVHVTYRSELRKWQAKSEHAQRAAVLVDKKAEALTTAREIARNRQVEVVNHNRDGKISDKDSYGHDPARIHDQVH